MLPAVEWSTSAKFLQVVKQAQLAWQQKSPELLPRAEFVGGSFFELGASLANSHVAQSEGGGPLRECVLHMFEHTHFKTHH